MSDQEKIDKIKNWLDEKNITNIIAIDTSEFTIDMDVFIIGTALNDRLARTASEYVEEKCKEEGYTLLGREGHQAGRWILLDLVDILVHIFVNDERELYALEKLWADGKKV
ncbi:MAG: ribosome silencing factor [Eubacteriaceae bacterium]|nr:ribosome silencing factor [Eubacteriaceae bacterium]